MKCPTCHATMRYTACEAPNCTSYECWDCGSGCDFQSKAEVLSRCANAIANIQTAEWQPTSVADVMMPLIDQLGAVTLKQRQPVVRRIDQRKRISPIVRRGIYMRDRGRCQLCGDRAHVGELDHIITWSAGGPDTSENLRLTCGKCNQERSNFHHMADAKQRMTPVATSCGICSPQSGAGERVEAFCMACRRNSTTAKSNVL